MTAELLRLRLREGGRLRDEWQARLDLDADGDALRDALLGAVTAQGEAEPKKAMRRYHLEYQGRTGGWRTFMAGA